MHYTERAGVRLAYDLRGEAGQLIALVQGLGLPGSMWLDVPEALEARGYTVLTPDLRGTGGSDVPPPPYSISAMAADLAHVIEEARRGPALVVAVSMGGMVAQRLALDHPQHVSGLVLAATTCGLPHGKLPSPRFPLLVLGSIVAPQTALPHLRRMMAAPGRFDRDPSIFDAWDRAQQTMEMPGVGVIGHVTAATMHSAGAELGRLRCPVVAVAGEGDQIIPADNARILARLIPGAELVILPDAGHAFPLEQPEALPRAITMVQRHLKQHQNHPKASMR
jgi:3-oxoadipate enol-lactonase